MKRIGTRKPPSIDVEHMKLLHQEAIDQLELMHTSLISAQEASGTLHDRLDEMAYNHWQAYLDVMHMIALHDQTLAEALKKQGFKMRSATEDEENRQPFGLQPLVLLLALSLIRRHRRFYRFYDYRGNPMNEYMKESMKMEREHMAELVSMLHESL